MDICPCPVCKSKRFLLALLAALKFTGYKSTNAALDVMVYIGMALVLPCVWIKNFFEKLYTREPLNLNIYALLFLGSLTIGAAIWIEQVAYSFGKLFITEGFWKYFYGSVILAPFIENAILFYFYRRITLAQGFIVVTLFSWMELILINEYLAVIALPIQIIYTWALVRHVVFFFLMALRSFKLSGYLLSVIPHATWNFGLLLYYASSYGTFIEKVGNTFVVGTGVFDVLFTIWFAMKYREELFHISIPKLKIELG